MKTIGDIATALFVSLFALIFMSFVFMALFLPFAWMATGFSNKHFDKAFSASMVMGAIMTIALVVEYIYMPVPSLELSRIWSFTVHLDNYNLLMPIFFAGITLFYFKKLSPQS